MSKFTQALGQKTRARIVELCREPNTMANMVEALGIKPEQVRKQCQRLKDEGWIDYEFKRFEICTYTTIRDDKYEVMDYVFKPKSKEETIPGARVFRMEYFDKIPGYFNAELRPQEFRGIGSTLSMEGF